MRLLTAEIKMAEVIHFNYLLIPVINRFGIRLGFGNKTVKSLCNEHNIDVDFFLAITNSFSNDNYFPEKQLQQFNIIEFITYLRKTHKYYLNELVPVIENYINSLVKSCSDENCDNLRLVKDFFLQYKQELFEHLNREETKTFPYIEEIYNLCYKTFSTDKYLDICSDYSIKQFVDEHTNVDDALFDLQNILIKYLNGDFNESLIQSILFELFRLEKDIRNHTRLEETILKPMVTEIETALKKKIRQPKC